MKYLKLMRCKHYLKNMLVFTPLFFSKTFHADKIASSISAFCVFCLVSSIVYIINDINDKDADAKHPTKCTRPIASGQVSVRNAIILIIVLVAIIALLIYSGGFNIEAIAVIVIYFILNVLYSVFSWKNIPIVDVVILATGFVLRVVLGGVVTDITISAWLYMVILCGAFYLGFGKRRNEMAINVDGTRAVLEKYNQSFLDKNMYGSMILMIVFFSLWCMEQSEKSDLFLLLIPLAMIICFRYSLDIESNECDGDPMNVILNDKVILVLAMFFLIVLGGIVWLY